MRQQIARQLLPLKMCTFSVLLAIFLSLLAARSADASGKDRFALFITETYRSSDGSRCETCEQTPDRSCYLEDRSVFVEATCSNQARNLAFIHGELSMKSSTNRIICRQRFETRNCDEYSNQIQFTAQNEDNCQPAWKLNECVRGERMIKLPEWCVESEEPVGAFIIPLLTLQRYDYREDCGSPNYEEIIFYPDDNEDVCSPLSFPLEADGVWTKGSGRASCNGGNYSATMYKGSNNCDGNVTRSLFDEATGQCPTEESQNATTVELFTYNCAKPKFFCKSMRAGTGSSGSSAVTRAATIALIAISVATILLSTV